MSCLVSHSSSSIPLGSPCEKKFSVDIDSSTFDPHISDHEPSSQGNNNLIHTPPPILDYEIPLGPGVLDHLIMINSYQTNHIPIPTMTMLLPIIQTM
jgi:hypothetical protein